jgi:hypothetical protein
MGVVRFWFLVGISESVCVSTQFPAIVADAGSTGTRVYAFHFTEEGVDMSLLGKITPGLSTFVEQDQVSKVADLLAPLMNGGSSHFGGLRDIPVHILGTGGVRSLSPDLQSKLWEQLREELELRKNEFVGSVVLSAIHGTQEAFYGLVSVRHLTGGNFGVLDLGGSSAEIAHAGSDDLAGNADDLLETHAQLGTEKIRAEAMASCVFVSDDEFAGARCSAKITEILANHSIDRILFDNDHDFYGVSAFAYSLDFAYWLFTAGDGDAPHHDPRIQAFLAEYPRPSLQTIRGLCSALCSQPFDLDLFTRHVRTNAKEATGRCFDVCYVAELLHAFGVQDNERRITFAISVQDREIEWTLGYYLTHVVKSATHSATQNRNTRDDL